MLPEDLFGTAGSEIDFDFRNPAPVYENRYEERAPAAR